MRRRTMIAFIVTASFGCFLQAQPIFPHPLSPRIANYIIDVNLDVQEKTLVGRETLVWTNTTRDNIRELQFHLYLNAFRNSESTFMKALGGASRGLSMSEGEWGWTDVTSMRLTDGTDLLQGARFIAPDDGNARDMTVLRVPLPTSVRPGRSVTVEIAFSARLPKVLARTGYAGNFFFVGQWFPKVGVYEPKGMRGKPAGGWNCHQFHSTTEFYADYGVYDVSMTVPKGYVLGATGIQRSIVERPDGMLTHTYRAEDVHDFAWTCSPDYEVVEDSWDHVKIRLLIQPEHADKQERYLQSAKEALAYFDKWLGKYPYSNLTIVDPPLFASGAGGMEYPTLITGLSVSYLPESVRLVELVTIHEFGHEYWYGLVGSNEFEEAWMDEGLNQYSEGRIMDALYGTDRSVLDVLGYHEGDVESNRISYVGMDNPKIAPMSIPAWEYASGGYSAVTYSKTATVLATLERIVGIRVMDEAMRTYFERWRFRHPGRADFEAVINEVVRKHYGTAFGPSMDWFFSQMIGGTDVCDYEVTSMVSQPVTVPRGRGADTSRVEDAERRFESVIVVSRLGEVVLPVDVRLEFADGDTMRMTWDGKGRVLRIRETRPARVVRAEVDPDRKLLVDVNIINNARAESVGTSVFWKYALKTLYWFQNVVHYTALF